MGGVGGSAARRPPHHELESVQLGVQFLIRCRWALTTSTGLTSCGVTPNAGSFRWSAVNL
jgi:hypothetical protein